MLARWEWIRNDPKRKRAQMLVMERVSSGCGHAVARNGSIRPDQGVFHLTPQAYQVIWKAGVTM